jgi:hypothetical protein
VSRTGPTAQQREEVVAGVEDVLDLVEDQQGIATPREQALGEQIGREAAFAREPVAVLVGAAHLIGTQPAGVREGARELGLAGAGRAVQQGVDADRAGRRGTAEDRLQMREGVGDVGKGRQRPGGRGCRLDQDAEECLGIRRLGIEELAQQTGRTNYVFQVAGIARVVEQTESTQRGLAGQRLAQDTLGDCEGRAQTDQVDARGGLLVAAQEGAKRLLRVVLDKIRKDLQGGLVQAEALAEHGEQWCWLLRRIGRRQARQDRARDPSEESAQTPAQDGVVLRPQECVVVPVGPSVVRVATEGVGQEFSHPRRLEERETEGPECAECGRVFELGLLADQLPGIARGPPCRGRHTVKSLRQSVRGWGMLRPPATRVADGDRRSAR